MATTTKTKTAARVGRQPKLARRPTAGKNEPMPAVVSSYLVRFENVGRDRLSWEERIDRPIDEDAIVAAVRRKGALLSRSVSAPYVHDWCGHIFAGIRAVGTYVIVMGSGH